MKKIILIILIIIVIGCIQGNKQNGADTQKDISIIEERNLRSWGKTKGSLFIIRDKKTEKEFYIVIGYNGGVLMEERK